MAAWRTFRDTALSRREHAAFMCLSPTARPSLLSSLLSSISSMTPQLNTLPAHQVCHHLPPPLPPPPPQPPLPLLCPPPPSCRSGTKCSTISVPLTTTTHCCSSGICAPTPSPSRHRLAKPMIRKPSEANEGKLKKMLLRQSESSGREIPIKQKQCCSDPIPPLRGWGWGGGGFFEVSSIQNVQAALGGK